MLDFQGAEETLVEETVMPIVSLERTRDACNLTIAGLRGIFDRQAGMAANINRTIEWLRQSEESASLPMANELDTRGWRFTSQLMVFIREHEAKAIAWRISQEAK